MKKMLLQKVKRIILLLVLLMGITWISGCSVGSALSVRSLSADRLSSAGEQELIQKIKNDHETWYIEKD